MNDNRKRILKNSFYMYIRMMFVMLISLYTSRVVLEILGEDDFGIYVLVGGVVSIFTIMSGSLSNSVQRFLNIGLGSKDKERTELYFTQSLTLFLILIALFLIVGETFGLWFVLNKLNYPETRSTALFWVYQFTLFAVLGGIFQIPFSGAVIAREKLNIYAFLAIFDVVARLIIVVLLRKYGSFDNLIIYALSIALMQMFVSLCYFLYSSFSFEECVIKIRWKYNIVKELVGYMGLSFFGTTMFTITQQGLNIILNIFFGPVINAAKGISTQVSTAIWRFCACISTPINPQIVKSYASGETEEVIYLFERSTKISLFIMMILGTPILFETKFILNVWLKNVPDYAIIFTQLALLDSFVACFTIGASTIIGASGKLMRMEVWGRLITLSVLPISYLILKIAYSSGILCDFDSLNNYGVVGGGTMLLNVFSLCSQFLSLLLFIIARIMQVLFLNVFSLCSQFLPILPILLFIIAQVIYVIYVFYDLKTKIDLKFKRLWTNILKPVFCTAFVLLLFCGFEVVWLDDNILRFFVIGFTTVIIGIISLRKEIVYLWKNFIRNGN